MLFLCFIITFVLAALLAVFLATFFAIFLLAIFLFAISLVAFLLTCSLVAVGVFHATFGLCLLALFVACLVVLCRAGKDDGYCHNCCDDNSFHSCFFVIFQVVAPLCSEWRQYLSRAPVCCSVSCQTVHRQATLSCRIAELDIPVLREYCQSRQI